MKEISLVLVGLGAFVVVPPLRAEQACYKVEGMTCASCAVTAKKAIQKLRGIEEINISVEEKEAVVQFDDKLTDKEAIQSKINDAGYQATQKACKSTDG